MDLTSYTAVRPYTDSGDMIEFASATILGRAIRFFTKKKVNHTALVLNLEKYEGLKDRRFLLEALEHGIQLSLLSKRLKEFKGRVYWSRLRDEFEHDRQGIAAWAIQQVGTKYDYRSLFKNMFGKVNQDARAYFCSEFYHMSLVHVGILGRGVAVRPGEFEQFKIFKHTVEL